MGKLFVMDRAPLHMPTLGPMRGPLGPRPWGSEQLGRCPECCGVPSNTPDVSPVLRFLVKSHTASNVSQCMAWPVSRVSSVAPRPGGAGVLQVRPGSGTSSESRPPAGAWLCVSLGPISPGAPWLLPYSQGMENTGSAGSWCEVAEQEDRAGASSKGKEHVRSGRTRHWSWC